MCAIRPAYIIFLDLIVKIFCGYEFTVTFFHLLHLMSNILLSSVHKRTSRTATDDADVLMLDIHITELSIYPSHPRS